MKRDGHESVAPQEQDDYAGWRQEASDCFRDLGFNAGNPELLGTLGEAAAGLAAMGAFAVSDWWHRHRQHGDRQPAANASADGRQVVIRPAEAGDDSSAPTTVVTATVVVSEEQ